jgi:hypothetical protein
MKQVFLARHSVGVDVKALRPSRKVWYAQHPVVNCSLVKQFATNENGQAAPKPELQGTGKDEAAAIEPTALVVIDKRLKDS